MTTTLAAPAQTTTWTIDASHSSIEFAAKHMMITTVKGRLADARGTITLDEAAPERSAVDAEFDAASIDTRSEQRDGHTCAPPTSSTSPPSRRSPSAAAACSVPSPRRAGASRSSATSRSAA
jgi:hypothetical protein